MSSTMGNILKIKDENGRWVDIPAIVGPQGPQGEKGEDNLFAAVYGETTAAEIEAAYQAGKEIQVKKGDLTFTQVKRNAENDFSFFGLTSSQLLTGIYCSINDAGTSKWTNESFQIVSVKGGTMTGALVACEDSDPSTEKMRNTALVATETTPTKNGVICWQYE